MLVLVPLCWFPELSTFHVESIFRNNFGRPSAAVPLPVVFGGVWFVKQGGQFSASETDKNATENKSQTQVRRMKRRMGKFLMRVCSLEQNALHFENAG